MAKNPAGEQFEMSFFDHLEELRLRIGLAVLGIVIGCIIAGAFVDQLMNWVLLKPAASVNMELQNLRPFGQAFLYFKVVIMAGLIISMPYTLYQLWKFIAPGLYEKERRWAGKITIYTSFCFLAGVAFAYWIMIPVMLSFTASFGSSLIKNSIDVTEYFSFITTTLLSAGLIFELPMIAYILSKIGIISPEMLRKYRRHSIVVILVLAAALTPSTDPVSQLVFAAPLWVLYEISILVTVFARKKEESVTSIE
ncbi:MAG: twin-arginine translocase subunit TatC [Ignavibacteriae bacterium]|jgi:sec-independent protein translocase protein TatC|nr:twin-arginine translocase subunit TatC [Ignavibacteriota bacterium]